MKLISLNEWVEHGKRLPGRRLLESEEDDIIRNILDLICSPDTANFELAKEIAKGQFEDDNPTLYKKFLALFNLDILKQKGMYFKEIEIMEDGNFKFTLNSTGDVKITDKFVKNGKLIYQFDEVGGTFNCCECGLTSLEGCPQTVGGKFLCSFNKLTSLKGCPQIVPDELHCTDNQLTSLEGGPKTVGGNFNCSDNKLTSLKGCPEEISNYFDCARNQLTSLEGGPKTVGGSFVCNNNQLTALEGGPISVKWVYDCSNNLLTSLKGCPQTLGWDFKCYWNELTSLEGCPQSVGGDFICSHNRTEFTREDVRSVCDVKGGITV